MGWATGPRRIPLALVSVEGFTVTQAVMLPLRAFTACQEESLQLGVEGALLRKKSPGLHKRTSNKLLSVTVLCFRPDLFFHVPLLPLSQRWGCRSEAGHGRAAYGRPAQDQRRNVEEPDSAVMFSTGRILSNIPDENLNIGTKPRHLDRVVLNTTLFTVFKAVLCGAGFGLLSSRSCSREQDKWEKLS